MITLLDCIVFPIYWYPIFISVTHARKKLNSSSLPKRQKLNKAFFLFFALKRYIALYIARKSWVEWNKKIETGHQTKLKGLWHLQWLIYIARISCLLLESGSIIYSGLPVWINFRPKYHFLCSINSKIGSICI